MSADPPEGTVDDEGSLIQLIAGRGLTPDSAVLLLQDRASVAQQLRYDAGASDVREPTRSTALWAAMQLDTQLRGTLERVGIKADDLASELSISAKRVLGRPQIRRLHEDFANAMREYLDQRQLRGDVRLGEVVLAILRSGLDPKRGLLPSRIRNLEEGIRAVERLLQLPAPPQPASGVPTRSSDDRADGDTDLSGSVRQLRKAFPDDVPVTPGQMAASLQPEHRSYADGAFASVSLNTSVGTAAPVTDWYRRVRELYDLAEVRRSTHRVIDGRLFLMGLAVLEPSFHDDLVRVGLLDALAAEVEVRPLRSVVPAGRLAGGLSSDRVDPNLGISLDRDRLGVTPYVSMLAEVICDRSTPMPLSVGVFGEWGSGKSFFMGMLRQRIDDVRAREDDTYWHDIRQIGFNAWHYADSNLWASLGDEIFRQLLGADDNKRREARLREELDQNLAQRTELKEAAKHAEGEVARLRGRVQGATAARDIRATDLLQALRTSPEIAKRLRKVWFLLGVSDQVEQGRILAEQVGGAAQKATVSRRFLATASGRLVASVAVLALIALAVATIVAPSAEPLLRAGAAAISASLAAAITVATTAQSGLKLLGSVMNDVQTGVVQAAEADSQAVIETRLQELREAEAASDLAASQLATVVERVGQLGQELAELAPGRRLYSFLAERAQAGNYSRNLGLISTIRKDFEHLTKLMEDWRNRSGEDEQTEVPIDRIVLYIDDLDRCSPSQVVKVLQAVHLLLALELFVVVVGVDPRWLLRSLQQEYPKLLDAPADQEAPRGAWDASPEDYLEKIFGIPLILPGMSAGSLERVLLDVVRDQQANAPSRVPDESTEADVGGEDAWSATSSALDETVMTLEPGSQAASGSSDTAEPPPRPLDAPEIKLLSALEPLVATPREAKRLVNLYRMIRSSRDLSDKSRFMGDDGPPGEFQAVILLLGLLSAHSGILGDVLDATAASSARRPGGLLARPPSQTWPHFVAGMEPHLEGETWSNDFVAAINAADRAAWRRLRTGLEPATGLVTLRDLSDLQTWAPRIRRFSFVMSAPTQPSDG